MLNLQAKTKPQELILAYLQENATETLIEKINNGVPVEKNGVQLISKKTLDGFMTYANSEARKLAEKGANAACIEDTVVYGWAMHYFEEDSIEGKLYNQDGTEYKPVVKSAPRTTAKPVKAEPPKPTQQQTSLWEMMAATEKKPIAEQADDDEPIDNMDDSQDCTDDPSTDEIADALQKAVDEKNERPMQLPKPYPPFYAQYLELQESYPEHIALMRLGDFYEAFDSDAETLADELNLTLTSRKLSNDERVPMVGFPYHAVDIYLAKIRAKHDVVIVEIGGDIKTLAKTVTVGKKTIDRDTGEVLNENTTSPCSPSSAEQETLAFLNDLLDGKLKIV